MRLKWRINAYTRCYTGRRQSVYALAPMLSRYMWMTFSIKYSKRSAIMAVRPSILNIQSRSRPACCWPYTGGDTTLGGKLSQLQWYILRCKLYKITRKSLISPYIFAIWDTSVDNESNTRYTIGTTILYPISLSVKNIGNSFIINTHDLIYV